jgi:hypothetical protein
LLERISKGNFLVKKNIQGVAACFVSYTIYSVVSGLCMLPICLTTAHYMTKIKALRRLL